MMTPRTEKVLIGWTEYIDLPDWGIRKLRAKVDTGARTSALHVEGVKILPRGRVGFFVVLNRKSKRRVWVETHLVRYSRVRSSSGTSEMRPFVRATLQLGTKRHPIEISLVDRGDMIFRMLLGRQALAGPFLIDPGRRHVTGERRRRKSLRPKKKRKVG